jgi:hypothetical protein
MWGDGRAGFITRQQNLDDGSSPARQRQPDVSCRTFLS